MSARDGMNIPGIGNGDMAGKADMDDQVLIITCNECSFHWEADMSVYGDEKELPFKESQKLDAPVSLYAATKKANETIAFTYHHLYNIPMAGLRFFTVYGPRQRPDLAIHKFAKLIEQDKPIPVFGDGTMMRDFTYIDDIVNGIVAAINMCNGFNIYNLGESRPITVNNLIMEIEKSLGKKAIRQSLPRQPGDVERTFADITKSVKELGYHPSTSIQAGLASFVAWLRKQD